MSFAELTVPKPSRARFPSVRVAKIPAVLLLVAGGVSAFVLIELGPYSRISLAFSIALMAVGIAGLVVRHAAVVDICLMAASIAVVVYAGEAGIEGLREFSAWRESNLKIQYAASQGRSFDLRSQREFLLARRNEGTLMYPAFPRGLLLKEDPGASTEVVLRGNDGMPLLPFGSISQAQTVRGNEGGDYLVYASDEHGFHNPRGIWSEPQLEIAAVGDSFVQGESVRSDLNMIATIRARVPETLNLGHGGNGPLSELGTILEYLPARKPKVVLWVFCEENDLHEDLEREKHSSLMMRYLEDPPNLQQLEQRQPEIDERLRRYFDLLMSSTVPDNSVGRRLRDWLTLHEVGLATYQLRHPPQEDFALFQSVLAAAQTAVSFWNGSLVFVYLPMQGNVSPAGTVRSARSRRIRDEV